ncbi:MAG: flagellar biosynthetic protein FliR [Actinomycetota bacterium]|nr:flagellar biosynthetic protein FliR [Actinomycetota bacterium]
MTIRIDPTLAVGYLMALARATAWIVVSPPFNTRMVPARIKVGLAAALALAVGPRLQDQAVDLDAASLLSGAAVQVAIGVTMGFIGVVIFAAIQAAGGLLDLFGGFAMAQVLDPQSNVQTSLFGRFYNLLAVTLLFVIGGHLLLVRGFLRSFDAVPTTGFRSAAVAEVLTADLGLLFVAALEIAAPLLAALFLADVALGLLSRAAPEMHVFVLGLPIKILLTLGLTGLALPLLPGATTSLVERIVRGSLTVVGLG